MDEKESGLGAAQQAALGVLLTNLPDDYSGRYSAIETLRHAFHKAIASALQPALNEHILRKPQDTPQERQELAAWINDQLRNIGLAVQCPKTKRPATLIVDRQDADHPEITRFRYGIRSEEGKYSHTHSQRNLGELELTEHSPRIEAGTRSYRIKSSREPNR